MQDAGTVASKAHESILCKLDNRKSIGATEYIVQALRERFLDRKGPNACPQN